MSLSVLKRDGDHVFIVRESALLVFAAPQQLAAKTILVNGLLIYLLSQKMRLSGRIQEFVVA